MARFFIERPIFAWVISIIIMLGGLLAILVLPVAQYPAIVLPEVRISAVYPGASAATVDSTVTQIIEQNMNGIDNLLYMSATSDSSGRAEIRLTFAAEANHDIAQVQAQNKLQLATPQLPLEVQQQGIAVTKSTSTFLMVIGFYSADGSMTDADIADYVSSNLRDSLARVPGVGQVELFGSSKAMRIWVEPAKLTNYSLTMGDIAAALREQNVQISAGQFGSAPAVSGQEMNAPVSVQDRLRTEEEFRDILLRVNPDGSELRLGDVARVELGQENYDSVGFYNGMPATGVAINLATGANAIKTAAAVKEKIDSFRDFFPPGFEVVYPYDTTPFVVLSIKDVCKTLAEAIVLVVLVMFLFLQNFRATLIPTIAVPVVLLGTFGVLALAGFSINTLTMFGMVLAIGLLVDDAIVVVENVERVMREEKLSPKEATRKSMEQITGALVGIAMVLSAVFVPMAFFGGSTGAIYRQFSITIVSSMALSVLVALTLTPALCSTVLRPHAERPGGSHGAQGGFFGAFNRGMNRAMAGYDRAVGALLANKARPLAVYGLILALMVAFFLHIPKGFLPDEDQGVLMVQVQLPAGATQNRTLEVLREMERHFLRDEKAVVESMFDVAGFSFAGWGQNVGFGFVKLKDWSERKDASAKAPAVAARAMARFAAIRDAQVYVLVPPAVIEMGNSSGFDVQLQDRAGLGHDALMAARNRFLALAASDEYRDVLAYARPNGLEDVTEFRIEVDKPKARALGVSLTDINETLQSGWGSAYINDFVDKGRVMKVYLQAEAHARMVPEDLDKWHVRNAGGGMVPFSAFIRPVDPWHAASPRLERYNGLPSLELLGEPLPGKSTGQAMAAVEEIAKKLPKGIGFEWTGISLQEKLSGEQAPALYAISLLVVFLCLAALYESWSIPFSVMLVVPLGVIGVQLAAVFFGQTNGVYFQVGFLTIIGLSAKNAILIVEFAKTMQEQGQGLIEATRHACSLRLRPIVMTSLAFGLGTLPLALSGGAGSGSQNAIGLGIVGGMISTTLLGIFLVPVFYVLIRQKLGRGQQPPTR